MNRTHFPLTIALWSSLLAGILVSWSPLYWPFALSIMTLSVAGVLWGLMGGELNLIPELGLVAVIGGWGFLQIATHQTAVPAMTLRASLTWLGCAIAFLLGSNILRGAPARDLFLRMLMWSLAVLAVEALLQFFISPQKVFGIFEGAESVTGTMFYRNQFAALMEIGGAAALWQVLEGRPVVGALCFSFTFGAVVATASRAGAALMTVELAAFFVLLPGRKMRGGAARSAGLLLMAFALAASAVVGTDTLWERFQDKDLFATRRELRSSTLRMIPAAPLMGTGLGTWRVAYPRYATLDLALVANEAHNDWLQWAADGGIPFAACLLALAVRAGLRAVPEVWGVGLVAVMAHCLVDYPMRAPAISFLWFTLAGAACGMRGREETATENAI